MFQLKFHFLPFVDTHIHPIQSMKPELNTAPVPHCFIHLLSRSTRMKSKVPSLSLALSRDFISFFFFLSFLGADTFLDLVRQWKRVSGPFGYLGWCSLASPFTPPTSCRRRRIGSRTHCSAARWSPTRSGRALPYSPRPDPSLARSELRRASRSVRGSGCPRESRWCYSADTSPSSLSLLNLGRVYWSSPISILRECGFVFRG